MFEEDRNDGENRIVERIQHFKNITSLHVLHDFVAFKSRIGKQGNMDVAEGSFVCLALLHLWIATVVMRLAQKKSQYKHRQKLHTDNTTVG